MTEKIENPNQCVGCGEIFPDSELTHIGGYVGPVCKDCVAKREATLNSPKNSA
jgi:formylmethanofuran dehydrogenase subunit E